MKCLCRVLNMFEGQIRCPMLAINRKLGYQPEPGYFTLVKEPIQ
jgi:hypothetical protein